MLTERTLRAMRRRDPDILSQLWRRRMQNQVTRTSASRVERVRAVSRVVWV